MNIDWAKKQWKVGIIETDYIDFLKYEYISRIFEASDSRTVNALVAYAGFLNSIEPNSDNYPLFLELLDSNNATAVDALLEGHAPETFMNFVVPNHFIIQQFFRFLDEHKRNEVYKITLEVIIGFFAKVYDSPEEGYQLYRPSITDVNALGKFLDETMDQDDALNRVILDVLLAFSKLDKPHETDQKKLDVARQSSRIRSDYFDNTRSLLNSMTAVTLSESDRPNYGLAPEYVYGRRTK